MYVTDVSLFANIIPDFIWISVIVFDSFLFELTRTFNDKGMGMDPMLDAVRKNVMDMKSTYSQMNGVLNTYDQKLVQVLG